MNSQRKFYFRVAGEVRGPASVEQLRDFASVNVVTPETEAAASASGPWAALATLAIFADVFPARRAIEFKAAEFDTLNHDTTPAVVVDEIKGAARRPPEALRGREVMVSPAVARLARDGDPANDVEAMVLEVGRRVAANAPEVVLPPPPRSWHWLWFAVPSVLGTGAILCIPLLYTDRKVDQIAFAILGGWAVLFNGLLAALFVLDRQLRARVSANLAKMEREK